MAIFANGPGTQTTSVGTASGTVAIFNTAAAGLTGTLKNILIENTGTATIFVGSGTAVSTTTGVQLLAGQQLLFQGTAINMYAVTSAGTATVITGLATIGSTID
jgi:hypothetical protein